MDDSEKELASSTLRSIALNYIHRTSPKPPKALLNALNRLKKRDDIIITKPDKGSGVVVMDKTEYIRLLSAASIDNTSKFVHVDEKRPKRRGRPAQHFHPLYRKKKSCAQPYVKFYLKRSLTRFLRRVQDCHTVWPSEDPCHTEYETHFISNWLQLQSRQMALSHSPSMTTQSLMPLLLLMKSVFRE